MSHISDKASHHLKRAGVCTCAIRLWIGHVLYTICVDYLVLNMNHWKQRLLITQVGSSRTTRDRRWSTKWPALSRWIVICSAWSTVRCHRLWLVQLPSQRQDVWAQHTRHSTHRQRGRLGLWQRLGLVESDLLHGRLSHTHDSVQRLNVVSSTYHIYSRTYFQVIWLT